MKKIYFILLAVLLTAVVSCNKDEVSDQSVTGTGPSGNVEAEGYSYSFENVTINPSLVIINEGDAELLSSAAELEQGVVKMTNVSDEMASQFVNDAILYIQIGDYVGARKIESMSVVDGNYVFETVQAQLGEIIEEGELNFSVDLYEARDLAVSSMTQAQPKAGVDYEFQLVQLMEEYDLGNGLTFNPATDVKMLVHFSISFKKFQILPKQVKSVFELQTNINPTLAFEGSLNGLWETDMVQFVPQALLDYVKTLTYTVPVEIGALNLSAEISVTDINIPTSIEANFSQQSALSFGLNGAVKLGYQLDINGFSIKKTPIFSNTLSLTNQSAAALHGEIVTNMGIVAEPNIAIIGGLFNASGDISFNLRTVNVGGIQLPGAQYNYGSKGTLTSIVAIDLGITSIDVVDSEQELWSVGSLDNMVVFKDLAYKAYSYLMGNQGTTFTVGYEYAVLGKQLPSSGMTITYKVLSADKGITVADLVTKKITPTDITNNSFQFKLSIPFRRIKGLTYETTSYITDIVITDGNGYQYEGIYDSETGTVLTEIKISR